MDVDAGRPDDDWEDPMTSSNPNEPPPIDPPTQSWPSTPPPAPAATAPPPPAIPPPTSAATPPPTSAATPPPRAPDWRPPQADHGRNASLIFGIILLIVGAWFFATRTLGLDLPDLNWGQLWPIFLIGIGAWIVLGAVRRTR
jgi:hypothetical protein